MYEYPRIRIDIARLLVVSTVIAGCGTANVSVRAQREYSVELGAPVVLVEEGPLGARPRRVALRNASDFSAHMNRVAAQFPDRTVIPLLDTEASTYYGALTVGTALVALAVTGEGSSGFGLDVDLNCDGELDELGLEIGPHTGDVHLFGDVDCAGAKLAPAYVFRLRVGAGGEPDLVVFSRALRRGTIDLPGTETAVQAMGESGLYNDPFATVLIDLDGDGRAEPGWRSEESHLVGERFASIAGTTYVLFVSSNGATLTLRPVDRLPQRAVVGAEAPLAGISTADGQALARDAFRGCWTVVHLWDACCASVIPEIVRIVDGRQDMVVVSIAHTEPPGHRTSESAVVEVRADQAHALQALFRGRALPTTYLVDPAGTIIAAWRGISSATPLVGVATEIEARAQPISPDCLARR